ncbi:hypothetical protein X943_001417 [Babesia divergens]|uniref:Uncharacterized protein n=1 Tax=Babesia divergens TaxID=32595 RepID=A0AAD9GJR6_BABDI|nr:hypothetical protein X943_001417 [Babesia divergens]
MQEELATFSRVLPKRTATVYFILFLSTMIMSITLLNMSDKVFRDYTSCHGNKEYDISIFMVLISLQFILLLFKVDGKKEVADNGSDINLPLFQRLDRDGHLFANKKLKGHLGFMEKRLLPPDAFTRVVCHALTPNGSNASSPRPPAGRPIVSQSIVPSVSDMSRTDSLGAAEVDGRRNSDHVDRLPSPCQHSFTNYSICWNSLWMLFYHLIIFMGIHATLLASRIHGAIELNKHALETCSHLWDHFPLGLWSPRMRYPLFSENTFFLTYLSCTSFELIVRKSADASYVRNFFRFQFLKECRLFGTMKIILQCLIFMYGGFVVSMSMVYGYGSPMHIVSGFSLGMMTLWINAALTQLLQLSHMSTSTLDLNWLWSILSALNFWICGLLFYISVYGIPFTAPYIYLQIAAWIPLLILTKQKGKMIFAWNTSRMRYVLSSERTL